MPFLESIWPNDLEGQGQWPPFSITAERIIRCIFGANLVILAQIHYKLSCGQTKFPRILSENGQNDLEGQGQWPLFFNTSWEYSSMHVWCKFGDSNPCGQAKFSRILSQNCQNDLEGQWPPFSIPTESIPWCMFGANLVIPAQNCDELSCGQAKVDRQTDGGTDGGMDGRTDGGTWHA